MPKKKGQGQIAFELEFMKLIKIELDSEGIVVQAAVSFLLFSVGVYILGQAYHAFL